MSRVAYVNGQYLPHSSAAVHIEDRGYQFADGVYEVCEVKDGDLIDVPGHMARLGRSLRELQIDPPAGDAALIVIMREVVRRNHVQHGLVYLQVTRGVAKRDHAFPAKGTPSALVMTARSTPLAVSQKKAEAGVGVLTLADNRWERVDIKTVSLLPNVLAKQKAKEAGCGEAWFVDKDGYVTEGSSTNAWIVTKDNELITRPATPGILKGITRETVLKIAKGLNLTVQERHFTVAEAQQAKEAFITAATTIVVPVTSIDGCSIGNGIMGELTQSLQKQFYDYAASMPT